jgi:hypothetical protein
MADLVSIRMRLLGTKTVVAESAKASAAIKGIGAASATTTAAASKTSKASVAMASAVGAVGTAGKWAAGGGVLALGYGLWDAVGAFREAEKIARETEARLKSTGGVANVTAEEVSNLAEALSYKTRIDDEEIQAAENMLLSFTNLRNEVGKGNDIFNQTTEAVLDLAAGTKTDLLSATKQLGKAMNDPIRGLTALSRGGTQFSETQTKMIEKLVESGDLLGAQKIILRELRTQYKGSARAGTDSFDGLAVAWENLAEVAGKAVAPVLEDVVNWLTKVLRQARRGKGPIGDLVDIFNDLKGAVAWVADSPIGTSIEVFFKMIRGSAMAAAVAVITLIEALERLPDVPGFAAGIASGGDNVTVVPDGSGGYMPAPGQALDSVNPSSGLPVLPKATALPTPKASGGRGGRSGVPFIIQMDGRNIATGVARHGERAVARA